MLKLSAHVSHLTANMQKPVQAGVAVDAPQPRSYASIVSPHRVMVQQVVHAIDADGAERAKRACNVRVKGLPEEADESAEALHAKVQDMLSPLHVGELEFRAERVKSRVPMAPGSAGRSILVCFRNRVDASRVLAAKPKLRDTEFRCVYIDEDLTMLQMRQKHDALPLYFKAKDEGLRVRWEGATVQVRRGNTWVPY